MPLLPAILKIDPETRAVIAHTVPERPRPIEDLAAEVAKLKGAGARREESSGNSSRPKSRTAKCWKRNSTSCSSGPRKIRTPRPPMRDIDLD